MQIRWTRKALVHLNAHAEYVAQDNPVAATQLVQRIYESVQQLASYPASGRPGRVPNTRELIVTGTPYIVPYRIRRSEVHILRVLHAARRYP